MPIGIGAAILGSSALGAGANLAGGKKGASAATAAAQKQFQAAEDALGLQRGVLQAVQAQLTPYMQLGGPDRFDNFLSAVDAAGTPIDTTLPRFTATPPSAPTAPFTFQPTMADLEKTPGYQFTLDQGLKAAQARAVTEGGGGAAIRGAANYASGLAASTWPQVFNAELAKYQASFLPFQAQMQQFQGQQQGYQTDVNALLASRTMNLQQRQQNLNARALPITGIGLPASSAGVQAGITSGQQMASTITGAGAAQASGIIGGANAQIAGLTGAGNALTQGVGNYATYSMLAPFLAGQGGSAAFNAPAFSSAVSDVTAFNSAPVLSQYF